MFDIENDNVFVENIFSKIMELLYNGILKCAREKFIVLCQLFISWMYGETCLNSISYLYGLKSDYE